MGAYFGLIFLALVKVTDLYIRQILQEDVDVKEDVRMAWQALRIYFGYVLQGE